ncbi:MAG: 3-carboxy-cis,cis-muconate cycloisomerase [Roseovarius sp.]|nr:3-carboxy-cis,cis-muconate cycloisomerase [Roseovarius sp.]
MITSDWLAAFAGDGKVSARLADKAGIADMLEVEAAFSRSLAKAGVVPAEIGEMASAEILAAKIDYDQIIASAMRDGLPVPGLVGQLKEQINPKLHCAIHVGMTSQDVMDTSLLLAIRDVLNDIESRIVDVVGELDVLGGRFGRKTIMGRTRMQAALPVSVDHRISQWAFPLRGHLERLEQLRPGLLKIQLGGPVGTRDGLKGGENSIAAFFAEEIGLGFAERSWHTNRESLLDLGNWFSMVAGSLGKIGMDISLMSQQGVDEIGLSKGGSSSSMQHKCNPVGAELLVALSRYCSVHCMGMHDAQIHEQERSGVSWTLEWLCLPPIAVATAGALRTAMELLEGITDMGREGNS